MCLPGQPPAPANAAQATAMVKAGLGWLAAHDAAQLTSAERADCLRELGQAQSMHTAAQAKVLGAFSATDGHEADGHPTARSWLRWQTRLTAGAAAGAVGWMRRLAAHPHVATELACGRISESWARELCRWSDLLPQDARQDADQILLGAAAAGAQLADLAGLAEELRRRTAVPDTDDDGGFGERQLRLLTTFRGAGKLDGDLTPQCAAALQAVLDSLGKKAGPEDTRSQRQRHHDALEEALRRLIASGCLPQRAGQPTQVQLHMTLDQLLGLPGAVDRTAAFVGPAAPPGADCDAQIAPVVTGHLNPDALHRLTILILGRHNIPASPNHDPADTAAATTTTTADVDADADAWLNAPGWLAEAARRAARNRLASQTRLGDQPDVPDAARRRLAYNTVRQLIVKAAADVLSGPQGLAAYLRTGLLGGPAASVSLPLDAGAKVEIVPAYLRRLLVKRDRGCRFPGCHQPAMACHPHHIIPRSEGGPTSLANTILLCAFHHLIAIHRWGWSIVLLPDGTVTATSPDQTQVLHSHGPPTQAA